MPCCSPPTYCSSRNGEAHRVPSLALGLVLAVRNPFVNRCSRTSGYERRHERCADHRYSGRRSGQRWQLQRSRGDRGHHRDLDRRPGHAVPGRHHSFRYTFCTMIGRILPIQKVKILMRHSAIKLTADLYTDLGLEDVGESVWSLPRIMPGKCGPTGGHTANPGKTPDDVSSGGGGI
jgi:hypothetical protein